MLSFLHPLSRAKWPPPLSVFLLPVCIARLHSLAGEGAGGPNSYDSTESLVLYILYSLYIAPSILQIRMEPVADFLSILPCLSADKLLICHPWCSRVSRKKRQIRQNIYWCQARFVNNVFIAKSQLIGTGGSPYWLSIYLFKGSAGFRRCHS